MTIPQLRARLEDALRDKNKGLRIPQNILDLEYKYNKEFRDKARMGAKRRWEAYPVAPKTSKPAIASSKVETAAPKKRAPRKTKAIMAAHMSWMDVDVDVTPLITDAPKPRTKQTARKTVDVRLDAPKPRTKKTARKTNRPRTDGRCLLLHTRPSGTHKADRTPRKPVPRPSFAVHRPPHQQRVWILGDRLPLHFWRVVGIRGCSDAQRDPRSRASSNSE
ncbi:hypothetical protein C8R43DRAFT_1130369 [Mycena crocata]|nr:hypothetical protein C8R43DRAFT_1130369 [Mycena crocata]